MAIEICGETEGTGKSTTALSPLVRSATASQQTLLIDTDSAGERAGRDPHHRSLARDLSSTFTTGC